METLNKHLHSMSISLNTCLLLCGLAMLSINPAQAEQMSEYTAFGLEPVQALPDPESRQYITKTVTENPPVSSFNGEADKITQSVAISGHVLVIEEGHDNGIWDNYHENKTIRDLRIDADALIIRSPWHLPQTNVTIHARTLSFEDSVGSSFIDTTPYAKDTQALRAEDGQAGDPGGNITLHISEFMVEDQVSSRFILLGAAGQKGGEGEKGANGTSVSLIINNDIRNGISTSYQFLTSQAATYIVWPAAGLYTRKTWGNSSTRQRNGGSAVKPGISGNGGRGGTLASSTLVNMLDIADLDGGLGGIAAGFVAGGNPGSPRTIRHWSCNNSKCTNTNSYAASFGQSYSGASGQNGANGDYIELDSEFSWMTAPLLSQSLRYAKDLYLYGYYEKVEADLELIISLINSYKDSAEWDALDSNLTSEEAEAKRDLHQAEINQALNEALTLQQRLQAGLDYFSKPFGWVPGLYFEVNQTVYDNEIDSAMDVLWLTHSMQQNINSKQARKTYAQQMVTTLNEEIEDYKEAYEKANDTITNIRPRIIQLDTDTDKLKQKLEQRTEDLRGDAEEAAVLNGIRDSLLAATEHIPLANIATQVAFELPNIDPDKPLLKELLTITSDAAWNTASNAIGDQQAISDCIAETGDPEKCAIKEGVKDAQEKAELAKKQGTLALDLISGNSASNATVNAELQRILAKDPRWLALTEEMTALHRRKAVLVMDLMTAIDVLNTSNSAISFNLLAVDVFHQDVINTNDILDPRVMAYTRDMAQRARFRLELYKNFMVLSYQYRLVRAYPFALDMNSLFDDFCKLQAANDNNDLEDVINDGCNAEDVELSENDFKNLGVIYKEQISSIAEEIIEEYNNGGGVSQDTAVEFDIPAEYLAEISQNPAGVKLNLVDDFNLFSGSEEDLRISSIEVIELDFNSPNNLNYVDISFIHSGISQIRKEGESYLFQHYLNSDTRPIQWITRYNGDGSLQGLQSNSASSLSLIAAVIGNNAENLKIFASPGAWADLFVKRSASPDFSTDTVQISRMRIRVNYEYTPSLTNIKTLRVVADSISKAPPIEVLTADLKDRTNGQGNFLRSYATLTQVTLKAPTRYEQLKFQAWLENGVVVSTDPSVQVTMDRDKTILPRYTAEGLGGLSELPVVSISGQPSSTRIYATAFDTLGNAKQQFGVSEKFDIKAELHVSAEYQGSVNDIYVVSLYEGNWYMKDSNNNWLQWDVNINSLVPNATQALMAINPITVVEGLSGLAGSHAVFVGHKTSDGNLHYNSTPLKITVQ